MDTLKPNMTRASEAFSKGFGIALMRFYELYGYLGDIEKGGPALKQIMQRETESVWIGVREGEFDRYIDRAALGRLGEMTFKEIVEASGAARYEKHRRIAHGSALALAHSMVDEVLLQACWTSAYADPSAWLKDVEGQKFSVKELASQSVDELLHDAIYAKVESYGRMSVASKTSRLLKVCGQQIGDVSAEFQLDNERMAAIDRRRHDMLHSLSGDDPLPGGMGDLEFMQKTALTIICAVALRYGIKANTEEAWKHGFSSVGSAGMDVGTFVGTKGN
jgi:hypothetical protein